jgi:hypothetical protein
VASRNVSCATCFGSYGKFKVLYVFRDNIGGLLRLVLSATTRTLKDGTPSSRNMNGRAGVAHQCSGVKKRVAI